MLRFFWKCLSILKAFALLICLTCSYIPNVCRRQGPLILDASLFRMFGQKPTAGLPESCTTFATFQSGLNTLLFELAFNWLTLALWPKSMESPSVDSPLTMLYSSWYISEWVSLLVWSGWGFYVLWCHLSQFYICCMKGCYINIFCSELMSLSSSGQHIGHLCCVQIP